MQTMHCGFVGSRLRRYPPLRCAQSCGRPVENALRFPPPAHRPAAAHKLHSARSVVEDKIRERQNHLPATDLSLFHPGVCPNDRSHRCCLHQLDALARNSVVRSASGGREVAGKNRESSKGRRMAQRQTSAATPHPLHECESACSEAGHREPGLQDTGDRPANMEYTGR